MLSLLSLFFLNTAVLLPVAWCNFLDSVGSRDGRSLLSDGGRSGSAIDGTNAVQTIVVERVTDDKAVLRYQNSFDGSLIKFQVASRDPNSNALVMHTPITVSRSGSDESQTPNAALARVGNGRVVSCELTKRAVDFATYGFGDLYTIQCSLLTFDDATNRLSAGVWKTLEEGGYPSFPESVFVVGFETGDAIACYRMEHWEQLPNSDSRKDSISCRSIRASSNGLEFGTPVQVTTESADDLSMAWFDSDSALVCYSDKSGSGSSGKSNNYCRILTVGWPEVQLGNAVSLGERAGTYTADPCVVSRLTTNQGLACCETPSSIPFRSYLECNVLFADSSDQLSLSGGGSFPSSTLTVQSGWGRIGVETIVHLKDSNSGSFGKAEICYWPGSDQTRLTCDTVQVKESWSYWYWKNVKSLKVKQEARYEFRDLAGTFTGRFFSLTKLKENNPADLLACFCEDATAGPGKCKVLTR